MELQFSCAYDRFCIKLEVHLIMFSRMSSIAILQLAIMNHILILLDDEVRRKRREKVGITIWKKCEKVGIIGVKSRDSRAFPSTNFIMMSV